MLLLAAVLQSAHLFYDGFESGSLANWGDLRAASIRVVSTDPYKGERCVEYSAPIGKESGGHAVRWFMPGYDELWVRFAVKFADDFDQGNHMHLCALAGNRIDNKWSSMGKAGLKPNGSDFFVTNLEPNSERKSVPPPGTLTFYSYWPDMKISPDGKYWGNVLFSNPKLQVPRGKWVVMQMWMKLNRPGASDGEQAFWMDGKLGGKWSGIRFRDTTDLRLNSFSLDLYIHDSPKLNRVWFDELEISTKPFE